MVVMLPLHVMNFGPASHYGYRIKPKAHSIFESYKKGGFLFTPKSCKCFWLAWIYSQTRVRHRLDVVNRCSCFCVFLLNARADILYLMLWATNLNNHISVPRLQFLLLSLFSLSLHLVNGLSIFKHISRGEESYLRKIIFFYSMSLKSLTIL